MNIDDLTIGLLRELVGVFGGGNGQPAKANPLLGEYCVFRGYRQGVYAGKFVDVHMLGNVAYAEVHDCRRLQYQKYNGFTLSSVAASGLHSNSKLSPAVPVQLLQLSDDAEIFSVSAESEAFIREQPDGGAQADGG